MSHKGKVLGILGVLASGVAILGACDALRNVGGAPGTTSTSTQVAQPSQGRDNASRLINTGVGKLLHFDIVQMNNAATQNRCDPLGLNGSLPWPSRIGGGITFTPTLANQPSEYDWVGTLNETEYCLALRVPVEPFFPLQFSQIEFSLRAVNPCAKGHMKVGPPGNDYFVVPGGTQADFPSNDDIPAFRSLIDLNPAIGTGDVAMIVTGIDFFGNPASTTATMNFLGPTGWLVFMRDNAFQSGRFFNIVGALKGGPPAFFDTPSLADDGAFESVQVNGDNFDANSEPYAKVNPVTVLSCTGAPSRPYSFVDLSNKDETLAPAPGQGGFVFTMRRESFLGTGVVVNPNVPGPAPAPVVIADLIPPPSSGYNEPVIADIVCPSEDDHTADGPGGVHEIGWSVFFIHGS